MLKLFRTCSKRMHQEASSPYYIKLIKQSGFCEAGQALAEQTRD